VADTAPIVQFAGANQNIPTNAPQVQQLPAQYQTALDTVGLKKALAQALLARGMQQRTGQTIETGGGAPNRYVRPALTQNLSDLASTLVGSKMIGESQQDLFRVMQKYQADRAQKVQEYMGGVGNPTVPGPAPTAQSFPVGPSGAPSVSGNDVYGNPPLEGTASSAAPTAQGPQAASPPSVGDSWMSMGQRMQADPDATVRALGEKYMQFGSAMHQNEQNNARALKEAAYNRAAAAAEPGSVLASTGGPQGFDPSALRLPAQHAAGPVDPNNPNGPVYTGVQGQIYDPMTGQVNTPEPGTGKLATTEGLPADLQKKLLSGQIDEYQANRKFAMDSFPETILAGKMARTAHLLNMLYDSGMLDKASGALAVPRAELDMYEHLLGGTKLSPSTTYVQLAQSLASSMGLDAKDSSGLKGKLSEDQMKYIQQITGGHVDLTLPAMRTLATNVEAAGNQIVNNHNQFMQNFNGHARSIRGLPGESNFDSFIVTPDKLPAVSLHPSVGALTPPKGARPAEVVNQATNPAPTANAPKARNLNTYQWLNEFMRLNPGATQEDALREAQKAGKVAPAPGRQ
jgi:hypothetical protein